MHKNDFLPFIFFSYHSFSLSYLELQIIFPRRDIGPATATFDPRPRLWTRDRGIGPATATLDPRPRLWTCDPRPATRDPRLLVKLLFGNFLEIQQLFGNFLKKIATFWQLLDTFIGNFLEIHRQLVAKPTHPSFFSTSSKPIFLFITKHLMERPRISSKRNSWLKQNN